MVSHFSVPDIGPWEQIFGGIANFIWNLERLKTGNTRMRFPSSIRWTSHSFLMRESEPDWPTQTETKIKSDKRWRQNITPNCRHGDGVDVDLTERNARRETVETVPKNSRPMPPTEVER
jgi:hypothetical protein